MKIANEFKGTGDYNQMWTRVRHMLDISSGVLPTTSAMRISNNLFIQIVPIYDICSLNEKKVADTPSPSVTFMATLKQTDWKLIFIPVGKDGVFRLSDGDYARLKKRKYVDARKKDGKAKAATKFTDAIFELLFNEYAIDFSQVADVKTFKGIMM